MPTVSGDIFSLGADAGFNEGWVKGRVGGGAAVTLTADAEVCHGINLQADIEAKAQIEGKLAVVLPSIRAEGQAFASAGIAGILKIDPNLFDKFGLTVNVEAAAEASAAAKLAIGLDAEYLAQYGLQVLDGLAAELFLAFLREVTIEAGVWGKASYSAMARGHLEINGALFDDEDAGFTFAAGYAVGLKGGYGFDYFCGVNFDNVRRFYTFAVDRITQEIAGELRARLPRPMRPGVELVELLLPVGLHTAYDVGQRTALGSIGTPGEMVTPFLVAFTETLQRYMIDKLAQAADQLLHELLDEVMIRLLDDQIDAAERDVIHTEVDALIALLGDGELEVDDLFAVTTHLLNMAEVAVDPATWRRPVTLMWSAAAAANAVRKLAPASAGVEGSFVGVSAHVRAFVRPMPDTAPNAVIDEYEATLGRAFPDPIGFDDAVDYLVAVAASDEIAGRIPLFGEMLNGLLELFDALTPATVHITPGDVIEIALVGGTGHDVTNTDFYAELKTFCRARVDRILNELLVQASAAGPGGPDVDLYLEEAARPSLRLLTDFIFERFDAVAANPLGLDSASFLEGLAKGVSLVLYKIFIHNLVVVEYVVTREAFAAVSQEMSELEALVRAGAAADFIDAAGAHITEHLPVAPLQPNQVVALQHFLGEMLGAGAESFGPTVMTPARLEEARLLKRQLLLSLGGEIDWSLDADFLRTTIQNFANCTIGDPTSLWTLFQLQLAIMNDQGAIAMRRVPPALSAFLLALTQPSAEALQQHVTQFLADLNGTLAAAAVLVGDLLRLAAEARARAREYATAWANTLDDLEAALKDPARVDEIMAALEQRGKDNLQAAANAVGGGGAGPFIEAFMAVTFPAAALAIRPLVSAALLAVADAAGTLADIVRTALDADAAVAGLEAAVIEALTGGGVPAAFNVVVTVGTQTLTALTGTDVETVTAAIVGEKAAADLTAAMTDRQAELAEEAAAEAYDADPAHADYVAALDEVQTGASTGQAAIAIRAPVSLAASGGEPWLHPPQVAVSVALKHATPAYVTAGQGRRVKILVNGVDSPYLPTAWAYDAATRALTLDMTLLYPDRLRAGLNSVEVTVAESADRLLREMVLFYVDPDAPLLPGALQILEDQSQFNAPGSDHVSALGEYVALRWTGVDPLAVTGWTLRDRGAHHRFRFPAVTLAPGAIVRVRTGGEPALDTATDLHWGRRAAVWNNRGDSVFVLDENDVLRAQLSYGRDA